MLMLILIALLCVCEWYVLQKVSIEENLSYYIFLYVGTIISSMCAVLLFVSTKKKRTIYLSYPLQSVGYIKDLMAGIRKKFRFISFVSKEQQGVGESLLVFVKDKLSNCSKAIFVIDGEMTREQINEYKNCRSRNIIIIPILLNNSKKPSIVGDIKTYSEYEKQEIISACIL